MNLLRVFHIGSNRILALNHSAPGKVEKISRTALHTVKKPVRLATTPANTLYSHFITFCYHVEGHEYKGTLYVDLRYRCPQVGEQIEVFYDPLNPKHYACYSFGPSAGGIGW